MNAHSRPFPSPRHNALDHLDQRHFLSVGRSNYWEAHGLATTPKGAALDAPLTDLLNGGGLPLKRAAASMASRYGDARMRDKRRLVLGDLMLRSQDELLRAHGVGKAKVEVLRQALHELGGALRPSGTPLRFPVDFPLIRVSGAGWGPLPVLLAAQLAGPDRDIAKVTFSEAAELSSADLAHLIPEANLPTPSRGPKRGPAWFYDRLQHAAESLDPAFFSSRAMEQTMNGAITSDIPLTGTAGLEF